MEGLQRKDLALVCPSVHITLQLTYWELCSHSRSATPDFWPRRAGNDVRTAVVRNRDGTVRPGEPNPRACSTRLLVLTRLYLRFYTTAQRFVQRDK